MVTARASEPGGRDAASADPARVDAAAVEAAAHRLRGVAERTPLQRNERLSARFGLQVWLKREDLQSVRSYKLRGAYNLIAQLDPSQRAAGVVCASAGNHAQGVAFALLAARRSPGGSSCRAPRRGRSATASRPSAATGCR